MSEEDTFDIDVPHDREGSFEFQLVKKHQYRDRYGRQDSLPVRQRHDHPFDCCQLQGDV